MRRSLVVLGCTWGLWHGVMQGAAAEPSALRFYRDVACSPIYRLLETGQPLQWVGQWVRYLPDYPELFHGFIDGTRRMNVEHAGKMRYWIETDPPGFVPPWGQFPEGCDEPVG